MNTGPTSYIPRSAASAERLKSALAVRDACIRECESVSGLMRSPQPKPNYEDIYSLLARLYTAPELKFSDPLAVGLYNRLRNEVSPEEHPFEMDFKSVLRNSMNLMEDVVSECLGKSALKVSYMQSFLKELERDPSISSASIGTTNHDCLIESALNQSSVGYSDGFVAIDGCEAPIWRSGARYDSCKKISLYKLHGSIDWFRFRPNTLGNFQWVTAKCSNPDCVLVIDGEEYGPDEKRPMIILGTLNKFNMYTSLFFSEIFCRWKEQLFATDHLIVAGFSFGDYAISRLIYNWAYDRVGKRMVVIHYDSDQQASNFMALHPEFSELEREKVLRVVHKPFENCSWDEVKRELFGEQHLTR